MSGDDQGAEARPREGSPVFSFASAVEESRSLLEALTEHVEDHLGLGPDEVHWGHVADAGRLLLHLRQAAFAAGIGDEPTA